MICCHTYCIYIYIIQQLESESSISWYMDFLIKNSLKLYFPTVISVNLFAQHFSV